MSFFCTKSSMGLLITQSKIESPPLNYKDPHDLGSSCYLTSLSTMGLAKGPSCCFLKMCRLAVTTCILL